MNQKRWFTMITTHNVYGIESTMHPPAHSSHAIKSKNTVLNAFSAAYMQWEKNLDTYCDFIPFQDIVFEWKKSPKVSPIHRAGVFDFYLILLATYHA